MKHFNLFRETLSKDEMRSVSSNMMNEVYHLSLKVEVVEEVGKYDCYEGQRSKVSIMIQYIQQ